MSDVTSFEKTPDGGAPGDGAQVRQQSWTTDGPAELELGVDVGRVRVHLEERETAEVRVEVRHDPSAGSSWSQGLSGLVSWLGSATGGAGGGSPIPGAPDVDDLAARAVQAAEVVWSAAGRRLVVRSSQELPLRVVPLAVTVHAPAGTTVTARAGAGDVGVTGTAGRAVVRTGSGAVTVDEVTGDVDLTSGSGDVRLGPVGGRARVRTGSGGVTVARTDGPAEIKASSGDVSVGAVAADLGVRTGSGDVAIADARAGRLELTTGSGELRIGVHPGVLAELDLTSGSGRARSELDVRDTPPEGTPALHVRGRTGSGDVLVTRASATA